MLARFSGTQGLRLIFSVNFSTTISLMFTRRPLRRSLDEGRNKFRSGIPDLNLDNPWYTVSAISSTRLYSRHDQVYLEMYLC